jgi:hypothetical protein
MHKVNLGSKEHKRILQQPIFSQMVNLCRKELKGSIQRFFREQNKQLQLNSEQACKASENKFKFLN